MMSGQPSIYNADEVSWSSSSFSNESYSSLDLEPTLRGTDIRPPSPKRCKLGRDNGDGDNVNDGLSPIHWPPGEIPVEIFSLVTSHLSRNEIKILRLVCTEFDSKVSAGYFKNVVVPFRSELYGKLSRDETGAIQHPSSALFSNGLRIFESFGPYILRFALSLEIDEDALAHPPIKPSQRAIPSFWGIYRWPHQGYNRYSDLESIEQTADETQGMKEALSWLEEVTNLGLCCDAGLGFLVRPDRIARYAATQHPVFAVPDSRYETRKVSQDEDGDPFDHVADFNGMTSLRRKDSTDSMHLKRTILDKMTSDAGYSTDQLAEAVQILLDTEDADLETIDFYERPMPNINPPSDGAEQRIRATEDGGRVVGFDSFGRGSSIRRSALADSLPDFRRHPLTPANLTQAQKELLLELEWAHRAMIQSYVIAMVDNARLGSFNRLTTLTIAKIPSSHVHIFYREDLWASFPNLANVSLGVIADWRRISKPAPGCIDDHYVSPLQAVGKVYKLLSDYIGKQPRIESIHFEWICGGEFAPSFFQRHQYILPAPFVEDPDAMANPHCVPLQMEGILELQHVKHLSLKNCWVAPHVFTQFVRDMALSSLERLELESVSLSGPPTHEHQYPLGQAQMQLQAAANAAHAHNHHAGGHGATHNPVTGAPSTNHATAPLVTVPVPLPQGPAQPSSSQPNPSSLLSPYSFTNRSPDWHKWAGFLATFSPASTVRREGGVQDKIPDGAHSSSETMLASSDENYASHARFGGKELQNKLKCISLKSCGYAAVDSSHLKTRSLLPPGANSIGSSAISEAHASIFRFMQRSKDKMFGRVIPYIYHEELSVLTSVFGLRTGWEDIYSERMIDDAIADGIGFPGIGRISGVISTNPDEGWIGRAFNDAIPAK